MPNNMPNIFEPLIQQLESSKCHFSEPQSFAKYLRSYGLSNQGTAKCISIHEINNLKSDLRKYGYMVFRLGSCSGQKDTNFALAKLQDYPKWSEYFLIDEEIFSGVKPESFLPNVSIRQLFAFELLSELTENSFIILAIASGLMAAALDIETSESLAAPASSSGTFTFSFLPSRALNTPWIHQKGQVEIDALFVGKRGGEEVLFVIEAKTSERFRSLSKHKLVYPVLSVSDKVPSSIPIIPVYLRAIKSLSSRYVDFFIAECTPVKRTLGSVAINELEVVRARHLTLMGLRTY
jgi:hypothetical protein